MKVWDRRFAYLKSLPQVIITPHSAFLTHVSAAETVVDERPSIGLRLLAAGFQHSCIHPALRVDSSNRSWRELKLVRLTHAAL
jgi:hypothetical protein